MINVLLVDDQVLLRESIGYILDSEEDITIVGMAGNGKEAIEKCNELKPDVILMDIEMPQMDGVHAAKIIKEKHPEVKVIILTTFENTDNIMESFVVNVDGYIVKNINHADLILTIKCVHSGLTVIHESVKKIMIDRFKGLINYKSQYEDLLTKKEISIVKLIAKGASNKEIANDLNYSEGTIKNNVSKILEKLEMTDRIQIAIFAMEHGII
jgi:DNA-binding NarL/FixJ family response regulator